MAKIILILAAFLLVGCGDQGAIDRAVAAEIRMRAEAEIEVTRMVQEAELEKARAEWSLNAERNVLRRDLLLFSLSIILVLLVAFAGFMVLARIWNTSKGLSQAIVQKVIVTQSNWPIIVKTFSILPINSALI